jgi:cation transport ATPase
MAMLRQLSSQLECRVGYNPVMWQKFHILSRAQVFVVSSVCAVVIAVPFALASLYRYGLRF